MFSVDTHLNAFSDKPQPAHHQIGALDTHVGACDLRGRGTALLFGDGSNPSVLRASGLKAPRAIFVTYSEHERCISACVRQRASFPESPIYSRAQTRDQAQELQAAGATEVVVEFDELPRSATALLRGLPPEALSDIFLGAVTGGGASEVAMRELAAIQGFGDEASFARLVELYTGMDSDADGRVSRVELMATLGKSSGRIRSDEERKALERHLREWLDSAQGDGGIGFGRGSVDGTLGFGEFCRSMRKVGEWDEARGGARAS